MRSLETKKKQRALLHPFGEPSCEDELRVLKGSYPDYYYDDAPFNEKALRTETYLIVGSRGSGKTSLGEYFSFQRKIRQSTCIDVDEPAEYEWVLEEIAHRVTHGSATLVPHVARIWDLIVWSLVFHELRDRDPAIARACMVGAKRARGVGLVEAILRAFLKKYVGDDGQVYRKLRGLLASEVFEAAKEKVLKITRRRPVIVPIDTLEKYDLDNASLMQATAGLIQSAHGFNMEYAERGIHVKVFLPTEIFPDLKVDVVANTAKHIRDVLRLQWRPKDLVRLVCWRLHQHLRHAGYPLEDPDIEWSDFEETLDKGWYPYFGHTLQNRAGVEERTFPYIVRHTQMRPRQLVVVCNEIAKAAQEEGRFPLFTPRAILQGVAAAERLLADSILNSYSEIYPNAGGILDALRSAPKIFEGKYPDKVAKTTSSVWGKTYRMADFRRLVSDLGVVGVVRSSDEEAGILEADFAYAMEERLPIRSSDRCVIHPMFYSKLDIQRGHPMIVYPFPDHPEYEVMRDGSS